MGLFQAIQVLGKPRVAVVQRILKQSQYRVTTLNLIKLKNLNSNRIQIHFLQEVIDLLFTGL